MKMCGLVPIVVFILLVEHPMSCGAGDGSPPIVPVQEIEWRGKGGGFTESGQTENGFFGVSVEPNLLETWKWHDSNSSMKKDVAVELPVVMDVLVLPKNKYLAYVYPGDDFSPWPLVLVSLSSKEVIKKWEPPAGWRYEHAGMSRNGKFAALMLHESLTNPPPDYNRKRKRYRIGLVDLSTVELRWLGELVGHGAGTVRQMPVSDDGRYVALAGWNNGVALVDASLGKVLWAKCPKEAVGIGYAVFSSDGLTLYAADAGGGYVYAIETRSGTVKRRWCATETGESLYGMRISCLALSPDESWIAAGTGPEGLVFLFNMTADEKPFVLPHGLITTMVVSFSPDSQYLASAAGGTIKVWSVKNLAK